MRYLYKVLFSVCSTLVCTFYSVRSFAASCSFFNLADFTSNDVEIIDEPLYDTVTGCDSYITSYFINSAGYADNLPRTYYVRVRNCAGCNTGYELESKILTHTRQDTDETCTVTVKDCVYVGTDTGGTDSSVDSGSTGGGGYTCPSPDFTCKSPGEYGLNGSCFGFNSTGTLDGCFIESGTGNVDDTGTFSLVDRCYY